MKASKNINVIFNVVPWTSRGADSKICTLAIKKKAHINPKLITGIEVISLISLFIEKVLYIENLKMPRPRFELGTRGSSIHCSTN